MAEFYPSISIDLLGAAQEFSCKYVSISDDKRHIILQTKSSLFYTSLSHGARERHKTFWMSPWVAKMEPNHANLLALIFSTTSKKVLARHVILACTEMTAMTALVLLLSTLTTGVHINWYIRNYVFSM